MGQIAVLLSGTQGIAEYLIESWSRKLNRNEVDLGAEERGFKGCVW